METLTLFADNMPNAFGFQFDAQTSPSNKAIRFLQFKINVSEIQFHFENAKTFWTGPKKLFTTEFHHSEPCPKSFGIPKMKLDFQTIKCEFKSLCHKSNILIYEHIGSFQPSGQRVAMSSCSAHF